MDTKNQAQGSIEGRLPAQAPLAYPYVPFQTEDPPKYEARKGLIRGTLFPGLDLPFLGMVNEKELPLTPKTQLQMLAFAIQELALYLDTHREDGEALGLYRQYQELYHRAVMEYTREQGPLNHDIPVEDGSYAWLTSPWPWEYCANEEV